MDGSARDGTADLQTALEDTRNQFLAAVEDLRPKLHRFCTRMCGSALDGEDLVQETLAHAFYHLPSLRDPSRLEPWLFRIAHNKCVDFLRRERRPGEAMVSYEDGEHLLDDVTEGAGFIDEPIDDALAALVVKLPAKERASVLLKDVLDYRLTEVAEVVDSTVGGVKAALHRGRAKLRGRHQAPARVELDPEQRQLVEAYIECFNRQDWEALRRLIRADARIEVVGATEGSLADFGGNYFHNYSAMPREWKVSLARVDGAPVIVWWEKTGANWRPRTAIKLWWRDGKVVRIRDYIHVDYLLSHSRTEEDR